METEEPNLMFEYKTNRASYQAYEWVWISSYTGDKLHVHSV